MKINRIVGMEHNFNGHAKFKLITYTTIEKGFMGLTSKEIKKRILYVFDSTVKPKPNAEMYFVNDEKEVEKKLTASEYNTVADLTIEFQKTEEVNTVKEEPKKEEVKEDVS